MKEIKIPLNVTANNSCGNESNVQYSLSSKTDPVKEPFRIDAQTGTICLDSILDYEQCTIYQLHVYAHNINGRFSRALVNIHVEDVNDNLPIFHPEQYNVSIRENVAINSLLVLISANDADSKIYGKVCKIILISFFIKKIFAAFIEILKKKKNFFSKLLS
ncbi:unnamed protein product [Wuchereria bancrofti]|uniref:Cadherin domain-containing protein n=1 Tax=Wuchereria bancrofti TaxID=6293 RepID=A0A3P7G069_WUCBA|nr:unnamed protein product [Wuchereria bancrofti]